MAQHASVFEIYSGHLARSATVAPQSTGSLVVSQLNPTLGGVGRAGAWFTLPQPPIPFSAYDKAAQNGGADVPGRSGLGCGFNGLLIGAAGEVNYGICDGVSGVWQRTGNADTSVATNGFVALDKDPNYLLTGIGRNAPPLAIIFDGAALSSFGGFDGDSRASGAYYWAYSARNPYQGLAHFCDFEADPPDSINDGSAIVRTLVHSLNSPTTPFAVGTDQVGNPINANACSFAAVGPDCACYVEAGDIGPGLDQIPTAVGNNRAESYRAHPSVFMRRTGYVRSVARMYRDQVPVSGALNGMPIRVSIVEPSTASTWLIIVDGVAQVVTINHAELSRPRDIWNEAWVPLIVGGGAVATTPVLDTLPGAMAPGPGISQLRLAFLEYARYLGPQGVDFTQTGISA